MRYLFVVAALMLAAPVCAAEDHPLAWLVGCWSTPGGNAVEVWRIDGEDLLGFAVTVKAGSVQFYETLAIRHRKGQYIYTAWPSAQRRTSFVAERIDIDTARFVNPSHDYPQVIEYQRLGETLVARISKLDGSRPRRFSKVRCETVSD